MKHASFLKKIYFEDFLIGWKWFKLITNDSSIKYSSPLEFTYMSESESVLNIIRLHSLLIYKLASSLIYVGFVFLKTTRILP